MFNQLMDSVVVDLYLDFFFSYKFDSLFEISCGAASGYTLLPQGLLIDECAAKVSTGIIGSPTLLA